MVIKTAIEYMNENFADRISVLHLALNQAEQIIITLEKENKRLMDVINSLTSNNGEGYVLDSEAFNEQVCSVQ